MDELKRTTALTSKIIDLKFFKVEKINKINCLLFDCAAHLKWNLHLLLYTLYTYMRICE